VRDLFELLGGLRDFSPQGPEGVPRRVALTVLVVCLCVFVLGIAAVATGMLP